MSTLIQRFVRNEHGRDLIVGDIHGCFTRLRSALDVIGFNTNKDRLFSVGDLVDRGPESEMSLDWLDEPWFYAVRGNHEDMAIRWARPGCEIDARLYAANGGAWNVGNMPHQRTRFGDAFFALPVAIELETEGGLIGIVHADIPPLTSWYEFVATLEQHKSGKKRRDLMEHVLWSRTRIQDGCRDGVADCRAMVVGHTPLPYPVVLGNVHYIDTKGWHPEGSGFTFLDANTLQTVTVRRTQHFSTVA